MATWRRASSRTLSLIVVPVTVIQLAGCGAPAPIDVVQIPTGTYEVAFNAAAEAVRKEGMPGSFLDPRGGLITTSPEFSGSLIEPWRTDNASFGESFENMIAFQRRRARLEFVPADFSPPTLPSDPQAPLRGPTPLASGDFPDLTQLNGPIELRVSVYVERAHTPNIRRFEWSRRMVSYYSDPETDRRIAESGSPETLSLWTPIGRDVATERRILHRVEEMLTTAVTEAQSSGQSNGTTDQPSS